MVRTAAKPRPMCACSVAQWCLALCHPIDCSLPGSSVHGISQQEYWSGFPFLTSGDLPDPGIEPASPELAGRFFTTEPPRKPGVSLLLFKTKICVYAHTHTHTHTYAQFINSRLCAFSQDMSSLTSLIL